MEQTETSTDFAHCGLDGGQAFPNLYKLMTLHVPVQKTRMQALTSWAGTGLLGQLRRSWRSASLAILALLGGFYLAQILTSLLIIHLPWEPGASLAMLLFVEVMVRARTLWFRDPLATGWVPMGWVVADNLRIGATYSVVLEAFKLGT